MNFVLMVFLFGLAGPYFEAIQYETLEECEAVRAVVPDVVAEHNASKAETKIAKFAAVCLPLKKAKQGTEL